MNIIRICVLLYFASSWNAVESTEWVDKMIKYIVEESEFKLVKLMTRLDDNETLEDALIEEIFVKVMENLPTVRINFGEDFELPANSVPDETAETRTPIDTSETLFLFVIKDRDGLSIPIAKNFIDAVAEMAAFHYSPKYLIVFFDREPSKHLEELLSYAWTKYKILDLTVLELTTVARLSNGTASPLTCPTIHQFNPFKKEHTNEKWTGILNNLFPNKVTDMSKYPLRFYELEFVGSFVDRFLMIIAEKFNCSIKNIISGLRRRHFDNWPDIYDDAESQNVDAILHEHPYYSVSWNDSQRSAPIKIDQFCILAPILPITKAAPSFTNLFMAFFLSIGIILIFWVFMRLLRFRTYPWRMFNIGRVLFGVSISLQPRGNVERIIFMCLLMIFAGYSSAIYEGITNNTWQVDGEVEFESFEDLDTSGLTLHLETSEVQRISHLLEGPLKFMKNRTVEVYSTMWCSYKLAMDKNNTCLIRKSHAEIVIASSLQEDSVALKLAKPCLWSEAYTYPLGKRSPYRSSIDKLILRMHSSGLFEKLRTDDHVFAFSGSDFHPVQQKENIPLLQQLMVIAAVGYSLSIFVFVGEIICHRVSMFIKSKRRPIFPRFPFV